MSLTPPINASGTWQLATPFNAALQPDVAYTCIAIREFSDVLKLGIDPYAKYYQPVSLAQDAYQADLAAGECIVTLQSSGGQFVYVPTSYIQAYPNMGGIPYTAMVLGIALGPLPNYLDLTALKTRITAIVFDTIGVNSDVKSVAVSETKNLVQADANAIESARVQNITNSTTDRARLLAAQTQITALTQQNLDLQAYIAANLPPPPAPAPAPAPTGP